MGAEGGEGGGKSFSIRRGRLLWILPEELVLGVYSFFISFHFFYFFFNSLCFSFFFDRRAWYLCSHSRAIAASKGDSAVLIKCGGKEIHDQIISI